MCAFGQNEKGMDFSMEEKKTYDNKNNVTKYGEFVCSEFVWLPINKQKENAKRLEEMTRNIDDREEE